MKLQELRTALTRILCEATVDGDSPVIVEGYTEDGDLMQGSVESVTTEARCEGDDEHQAVYINLGEETARLVTAPNAGHIAAVEAAKAGQMPGEALAREESYRLADLAMTVRAYVDSDDQDRVEEFDAMEAALVRHERAAPSSCSASPWLDWIDRLADAAVRGDWRTVDAVRHEMAGQFTREASEKKA